MLKKYLGETDNYEKKEKVERNKVRSWLKTVCAFANGNGGEIIFGVKEDNTIIGLDDIRCDSDFISEAIKTKIQPIPDFNLSIRKIDNKDIIFLKVRKGKNTPYFYIENKSREAYKRVGNQSVIATNIEITDLILKSQQKTFDVLPYDEDKKLVFKNLKEVYEERTEKKFEKKIWNLLV